MEYLFRFIGLFEAARSLIITIYLYNRIRAEQLRFLSGCLVVLLILYYFYSSG